MSLDNIKDKYLSILNLLSEGVWILDKELKIKFINKAGTKFLGLPREQIIGCKITEILPEINESKFVDLCKKIMEHSSSKPATLMLTLNRGINLLCRIQPYSFIPQSVLCISEDIEKHPNFKEKVKKQLNTMAKTVKKHREALLKSEERFETVLKISPLEVLIIQDLKFVHTNFSVSTITGYNRKEIKELEYFWQIVAPEYRKLVKQAYESRHKGERIPAYKCKLLSKSGEEKWVVIVGSAIDWKGRPADIVMLTDITELIQKQKELQESKQQLQKSLRDFTKALAKMVESRDPYTAGHQERVAKLAVAIAKEIGLSEEKLRGIQITGLVHDLGKIAIPAEILTKPIPLNKLEFDLIKTHPEVAYEVLKEIDFPWPIAEIVYQHHERIDGSGYPRGLKDDEILLEARILAVADVVEAMSSHRPYRPAHSIEEALEEVVRNKGKLYDPEVVEACVRVFKERKFIFSSEI